MDKLETLIAKREENVDLVQNFLLQNFDKLEKYDAEVLAPTLLDLIETNKITRGMYFRKWVKEFHWWKVFVPVGILSVIIIITALIMSYYANKYPFTMEVSKHSRFMESTGDSKDFCLDSGRYICVEPTLEDSTNETISELKDGETIAITNNSDEIFTITRNGKRFVILVEKKTR